MTPLVVAHRGNSSVAPENTVAALVSAARTGAHLVEIDLQLTVDGVGVVFHDHSLGRTAPGSGLLRDLDLDGVARLEVGSWFDPAYSGTPVPLLADVLGVLARYDDLGLLLEVSGPWTASALGRELATIADAGLAGRVIVQSFSAESLSLARDLAPDLPRGYLTATWSDDVLETCTDTGARWCNPRADVLEGGFGAVDAIHDRGLRAMVWTLNEPDGWAAALEAGADAIITDRPDRLLGWLAGTRRT
ncbi:glycerophosphodiester phosphodiesterase [Occultella kanbiaonis]|uniref:glycerophosphodiester phosphodiesterase n=1 Tax=Occultella kanbiaonis TaxID=2675754 RepID=UPI00143D3790|nr:glycerophosphodiester phosphodiesterase family protein [Occultella kanbiaonis]